MLLGLFNFNYHNGKLSQSKLISFSNSAVITYGEKTQPQNIIKKQKQKNCEMLFMISWTLQANQELFMNGSQKVPELGSWTFGHELFLRHVHELFMNYCWTLQSSWTVLHLTINT